MFLESLNSGLITRAEIDWMLRRQSRFSRAEQGQIQLGSRMSEDTTVRGSALFHSRAYHLTLQFKDNVEISTFWALPPTTHL